MYSRLLLSSLLLLACGPALAGQTPVYRWVTPDGTVVYSDIPSSPHARQVRIDEPGGAGAPATAKSKHSATNGHPHGAARKTAANGAGSSLCDQWRKRVALIRKHDQIYLKTKSGGRVKLTPKQRRQRLRHAEVQMKWNCSGGGAAESTPGGTSSS